MSDNVTKLNGFRWMPGMKINHIGQPMLVLKVEVDEWLGEDVYILLTYSSLLNAPLCTVIVKDETFLDLSNPATGGCLTELLGFVPQRNEGETLGEACARVATERGGW